MNDPTAVNNSWLKDYLTGFSNGGVYTSAVLFLSIASIWLFVNTTEGILETFTCLGLLILDLGSIMSEISTRRKSRILHASKFIGNVTYRNKDGKWDEKHGFDIIKGDILKLSVGSVVPADVKWLRGATFLCETTYASNGDHRFGGGIGGDSGEDLGGIVQFGPPQKAGGKHSKLETVKNRKETKKKEIISNVEIEEITSDSDDENQTNQSNNNNKKGNESSSSSIPSFCIESEMNAGAMVLTISSTSTTSSGEFAECEVLRIGKDSIGWQIAGETGKKGMELRSLKHSSSPSTPSQYVLFFICVMILLSVPYFLSQRPASSYLITPTWSQLISAIYTALKDQLSAFIGIDNDDGKEGGSTSMKKEARMISLASLIAIDQCKSLIHLGLTMVCYSCIGSRIMLQCCESNLQQFLAKRGALLKPKYSGCTAQRIAEVDTILLAHCNPRGVSQEDAAAIHRLKLVGVDIKVLSATSTQVSGRIKTAVAMAQHVVSPAEFLPAGSALSATLKSVGLCEDVVMSTDRDKVLNSGGILVALEGDEAKAHAEGLVEGAKRVAVWEAACEERRKIGPMKAGPIPRPKVDSLARSAIGDAVSLISTWQLNENRRVLVTSDDCEDGRTLPLLSRAHVGVVCGNTYLTKSRKKASSTSTTAVSSKSGGTTTTSKNKNNKNNKKEDGKDLAVFGDVGDVAMLSGMPLGLSPIADMFTICISTSRLEYISQLCRACAMLAGAVFLFSQVIRASWLTTTGVALSGLEAGAVWESSIVRRSVVFGGALRVPLALLLADVVALFVLTPTPPEKQRGCTDEILNASLSCSSKKIPGTSRRLGFLKQYGSLLLISVYSVIGVLLFQFHILPYVIPEMLPWMREYLEGTDLLFGSLEDHVDAQKDATSSLKSKSPQSTEMNEIDRDLCSFLFLIYSLIMLTLGCLSMSKAIWRTRLASPYLVTALPFVLVSLLALGTHGMLGGVNGGGDPASGTATLLYAITYFYTGPLIIFFFIPPFF